MNEATQRWEYLAQMVSWLDDHVNGRLDELGAQGWEAVGQSHTSGALTGHVPVLFKRLLTQRKPT